MNISKGVVSHLPWGLCHQLPHELLFGQTLGFQMLKLPGCLAYDGFGIGRITLVTEAIGEPECAQLQPTAQAARIAQHHAPGPDLAVTRERHTDGQVAARRADMSDPGGIGDNILPEINPPEPHRSGRAVAQVNVKIRGIHEPE